MGAQSSFCPPQLCLAGRYQHDRPRASTQRWLSGQSDSRGHAVGPVNKRFEQRESVDDNVLFFSDKGMNVADDLLDRLTWAPILPVSGDQK